MHDGKQQNIHVWLIALLVLLLLFPLVTQFRSFWNTQIQGAAVIDSGAVFDGAATSGLTNISVTVISGGSGGSSSSSGSGGGGGGQGGAIASVSFNMNQFVEQTNIIARIGKIYVLWNGEEYSARVGKPSADRLLLDFTVLGIKINLGRGESVSLDLDFDEEEDIKILLEEVKQNTATLTVTALQRKEEAEATIEQVSEEPRKETAQEKDRGKITKSFLNKDLWSVILLLILAIGFVIYQYKKNEFKKHKQRKRF